MQDTVKRKRMDRGKRAFAALLPVFIAAELTGCAAGTLAAGIADKSVSGSGTVARQRVGIDEETQTPVIKSTLIIGDYASALKGEQVIQYRRRRAPSIFNKEAVAEEVTITCVGAVEGSEAVRALIRQDLEAEQRAAGSTRPEENRPTLQADPSMLP